jgi:type IV pilus assembly protein PilW
MTVLRTRAANRQPFASGVTLVELLVSMLLGLLLVAGMVSAYLSASRQYAYEEQMARMQENGRYAMRLLSREFAMAGFYGGIPASVGITAASVGTDCSAGDWALDARNPLDLVNDYAGQSPPVSQQLTAFSCLEHSAIVENTDLVAIKRTAAEASLLRGVPAATLTSSTVEAWYLRVVSGVAPAWDKQRPIDLRDPGRALPSLSYWEAISRIIFIRRYSEDGGDGIPSLCMETLAGDAFTVRCLVEGVENLQLEFGIDTDDDGVPNRYLAAPAAAQMQHAVAVKVHLLLRSVGTLPGHRDDKTYRLGAKTLPATHDAYLRRVLSSTVLLRNHIAFTG